MNITKFIPSAVTRQIAKQALVAQKHSPRILFVVGVAGAVTSTVLACKATLKVSEVLDDVDHAVSHIKADLHDTDSYHKDLIYAYADGAFRLGKLYAPAIIIGTASIGALTGSHIQLSRRNAGLTAAYAALTKSYDEYRERVRTEYGEEKERDLYFGVHVEELLDENGKKHKIATVDPNKLSVYAKCFDEYSPSWQKNAEMNRIFVQAQQNYANDLLKVRGHVFLNEVYDMLGIPHTKAGAIVGWTVGNGGDNYIDFHMFEANNAAFLNGEERSIFLDFNVDGVILDHI